MVLFACVLLANNVIYCQENIELSPLVRFLQKNTDTTIILYYPPAFPLIRYTDQLIISRQGADFVYSLYSSPYKRYSFGHNPPKNEIGKKFTRDERTFENTAPDTNQYFLPKYVEPLMRDSVWKKIIKLRPWGLNDTMSVDDEKHYPAYDAGGICIILITKTEIKRLCFYDPWDFEKYYSGNINRQRILKIEKIFEKTFGKEY